MSIRTQIEKGVTAAAIIAGWQPIVDRFKAVRRDYLLY
jgi:hypothetical protein